MSNQSPMEGYNSQRTRDLDLAAQVSDAKSHGPGQGSGPKCFGWLYILVIILACFSLHPVWPLAIGCKTQSASWTDSASR